MLRTDKQTNIFENPTVTDRHSVSVVTRTCCLCVYVGGTSYCETTDDMQDQEQTDVSLITGRLRHRATGLTNDDTSDCRDALVSRNEQLMVADNSASMSCVTAASFIHNSYLFNKKLTKRNLEHEETCQHINKKSQWSGSLVCHTHTHVHAFRRQC